MDAAAISLATTLGLGAANMAHSLAPSLSDVRAAPAGDETTKSKVRTGEAATVLVIGAAGVVLWKLTGSTLPLALSSVVLGAMFVSYEVALRKPKPTNIEPAQTAPLVLAYG